MISNERLLRVAVRKRVNDSDLRTFKEWKAFYNTEKEKCEDWEINDSAELFEKEIWSKIVANWPFTSDDKIEMTKVALANIVEIAYQRGKRSGR